MPGTFVGDLDLHDGVLARYELRKIDEGDARSAFEEVARALRVLRLLEVVQ
jgi:hypothetical protein